MTDTPRMSPCLECGQRNWKHLPRCPVGREHEFEITHDAYRVGYIVVNREAQITRLECLACRHDIQDPEEIEALQDNDRFQDSAVNHASEEGWNLVCEAGDHRYNLSKELEV